MFSFMRRHWVAYLVGAILALALGFGVAYFVGVKGSLPAETRAERIAAEKKAAEVGEELEDDTNAAEEDDDALDDGAEDQSTNVDQSSTDDASQTSAATQVAEGEFQDVETNDAD